MTGVQGSFDKAAVKEEKGRRGGEEEEKEAVLLKLMRQVQV